VSKEFNVISELSLISYLIVVGVFLIIVPWTSLWPLTVPGLPWFTTVVANPIFRGAVSGFGLVLIGGAVVEIRHVVSGNR
jgi:hypothetical protein